MVAPNDVSQDLEPESMEDSRFDEVLHAFTPTVRKFFVKRPGCTTQDADDLTQKVFIRVWRNRDKLHSIENLAAWLKTIAVRVWENYQRDQRAQKRGEPEMSLDQHLQDHGETAINTPVAGGGSRPEDPRRRAISRQAIELAKEDLPTLPPKQRQALRLIVDDELTYEQAAKVLKVSVNTVKSHVSQGRKKLRELQGKREQRGRS